MASLLNLSCYLLAAFFILDCSLAASVQTEDSGLVFSNVTQGGKQYVGYNLYMNFLDFIEHCHKNNMEPASVLSAEENRILVQYIDGNFPPPKYFWLGGADIGREGRYYWIANLREFAYESWGSGYPNGGRDENCATVYGGDGTWYDQYCTNDGVQPLCQRYV